MKCLGWTVGVVLLLSLLGAAAAQPSQAERQIDDAKAKGLSACVVRGDHLVATTIELPSNFKLTLELVWGQTLMS